MFVIKFRLLKETLFSGRIDHFVIQTKYSTLFENCWSSFSVLGQRAAEKQSFSNAFSTTAKLFSRIRLVHFYHWLVSLFLGGIRFLSRSQNEKTLSLVRFPHQTLKSSAFSLLFVWRVACFSSWLEPLFWRYSPHIHQTWKLTRLEGPIWSSSQRLSSESFWKSFCRSPYSVLEYGPLFGDICKLLNEHDELSFQSFVVLFLLLRSFCWSRSLKERGRKRLFSHSFFVQVAAFGSRSWPLFWRYLHSYCAENRSDS